MSLYKKREITDLAINLSERQEFLLANMSSEMMSDEETDEESAGYITKSIPWRTEEMDNFMIVIDEHTKSNGMYIPNKRAWL